MKNLNMLQKNNNTIEDALKSIKSTLPKEVDLVAVSKYHTEEDILTCYQLGQRIFGESREQELREKHNNLPNDILWHFIGHLQTNKVKYIASYISLIHTVDSFKLLKEINKEALKNNRIIDCLLQVYVATENTKYGMSKEEVIELVKSYYASDMKNVRISGLMCMATNTSDIQQITKEFNQANQIFEYLKKEFFEGISGFRIKSWGMSNDYEIAVNEGANMVRVGSKIFGDKKKQ